MNEVLAIQKMLGSLDEAELMEQVVDRMIALGISKDLHPLWVAQSLANALERHFPDMEAWEEIAAEYRQVRDA